MRWILVWLRRGRAYADMLDAYLDVFAEILRQLHPPTSQAGRMEIAWRWNLWKDRFDAEASVSKWGRPRVEITAACLHHLQTYANIIFSSNDLFREVGDAGREMHSFETLLKLDDPVTPLPKDGLREQAAFIVTEMGMALIALHEIGHHVLGHFHFLKEVDLPLRLNEAPSSTDAPKYAHSRHLHLLELEADRFAFTCLMELAARHEPAFATQKVPDELYPHLLSLMILSYSLIILSLHSDDLPISWHGRRSHPHPAVRLMASVRHLTPVAMKRDVVNAFRTSMRTSFQILAYASEMHRTGLYLSKRKQALSRLIEKLDRLGESEVRQRLPRYNFHTGNWETNDGE